MLIKKTSVEVTFLVMHGEIPFPTFFSFHPYICLNYSCSSHSSTSALLLGMFFALPGHGNKYMYSSQGPRDGIRCRAMQSMGVDVYTLDDKHSGMLHITFFKDAQTND